jgi:DNA-binding SARP family transcriptional activator
MTDLLVQPQPALPGAVATTAPATRLRVVAPRVPAQQRPVDGRPARRQVPGEGTGVVREHLANRILGARVAIVTGAPGSGKTWLLAQCARTLRSRVDERVLHCSATTWANSPYGVLDGIAATLTPHGRPESRTAVSAAELAKGLSDRPGTTVFLDDAHLLSHSSAQTELARIIGLCDANVRFVIAGRLRPHGVASRLPADICQIEVSDGDLRLSAAEVRQLIALHSRRPSDDAAKELAGITHGWITGVDLLSRVSSGAPEGSNPRAGWPELTAYLDTQVLATLPSHVVSFLHQAQAVEALTPSLCTEVFDQYDGAAILNWLADRHLFIDRLPGTREYRLHRFFRDYLAEKLLERLGTEQARRWYHQLAVRLEGAGLLADAAYAFAVAEDWLASTRVVKAHCLLLPQDGQRLPAFQLLADARDRLVNGDLQSAAGLLRALETSAGQEHQLRKLGEYDLSVVLPWLPNQTGIDAARSHWSSGLREVARDGGSVQTREASEGWSLVRALESLLAGRIDEAVGALDEADTPANTFVPVVARMAKAALGAIINPFDDVPRWSRLAFDAEAAGFPWLARICCALPALHGAPEGTACAEAVRAWCQNAGDPWGTWICDVILGIADLRTGRSPHRLQECINVAQRLDIRAIGESLELLLRAHGVTVPGEPPAKREVALEATPVREPVREAAPDSRPEPAPEPASTRAASSPAEAGHRPVIVRCLGDFTFNVNAAPVALTGLRPRARSVLRFLAMRAGRPVHEELLMEQFWPDLPESSARHNLHVTVSAIRKLLDSHLEPGVPSLLVRQGGAYSLRLPDGSTSDLIEFDAAARRWRQIRATAEPAEVAQVLGQALDSYGGELLPDEGPAEWVCTERLRLQAAAGNLAAELARTEFGAGRIDAAIDACQRAIEIDRMHDAAWRLLIEAYESKGDRASARISKSAYDDVLAELGIPADC